MGDRWQSYGAMGGGGEVTVGRGVVGCGLCQVIVIGAPEHRLSVVTRFGIDAVIDIHKVKQWTAVTHIRG